DEARKACVYIVPKGTPENELTLTLVDGGYIEFDYGLIPTEKRIKEGQMRVKMSGDYFLGQRTAEVEGNIQYIEPGQVAEVRVDGNHKTTTIGLKEVRLPYLP